jgi:YD repeat-containing protein
MPNTASYIVGKPAQIEIHSGSAQGPYLAISRFSYDGAASPWVTAPVRGDVTKTENWLDQTGAWIASTAEYDTYGNKTAETDPLGDRTEWLYDPTYHIYPTETHDPLYSVDSRHKLGTTWDQFCSVPLQTTDMNGQSTNYSYDVLCRETNVAYPDGGFKSTAYVNFGSSTFSGTPTSQYIETFTPAADNTGNLWEVSYLDGLSRTYMDFKKGPSSAGYIVDYTAFDPRGDVGSRTFPYYADGSDGGVQLSSYHYDALGRPTMATDPDGNNRKKAYGFADTFENATVTDELGRQTTTQYDAYGEPVRLDRTLSGATVSTYYTHDPLRRLTGIQDAAGNRWTYTYDSLGRKITASDPDLGNWTYQYDNADRLTQVTDALGQVTRYTYDAAGRMLTKTTRNGTAQAATTTYIYDQTSWGRNVGHLTTAESFDGTMYTYNYDALGRIVQTALTVDSIMYSVLPVYDAGGRVHLMRYNTHYWSGGSPDTDVYIGTYQNEWTYDGAGRLSTIPGIQNSETYNAAGQPLSVTRANGVTTAYTYQASRQWLMGMSTTNAANTPLQSLAFTRDAHSRILTSTSDVAAESWSYTYDDFDRLTHATNLGDTSLRQGFTYDAVDNMTYTGRVGTYTYPAPGQPHPHAVTQAGTHSYTYDANGNMVTRDSTSLTYDGENRLVQDGTTSFVYAPDGSRLKKISGNTTTLYIGDDWEVSGGVNTFYLPGDAVMTNGVIS